MARRSEGRWLAAAAVLALVASACEPANGPRQVRLRPLPKGAVESPRDGERVAGPLLVSGWAVADGDVDEVNVYVDGAYAGTALYGSGRQDIAAAFPTTPRALYSGFKLTLESLPPGDREVTVQARSRSGATRDLASLRVQIESR